MLDNYRHSDQRALIWTPKAGAGAPCLINITYTAINSRKSGYYAGFGQELEIIIAQISLSIDQEALFRFHPFLCILSQKRHYNQIETSEDDVFIEMIDVAPVVLPPTPPSANGPLDGMHISVYIDKVTHSLTYLLTHLLTHSLTHSLTYLLTYSLTHYYSLTHSLTHLLTYSLTHSLTGLLTYSLTHSLTGLLTHSLTYSLTHSQR